MEYTEEQTEAMYLDYFNNYLTVDLFAEHNQITKEEANRILAKGRIFNHSKYKQDVIQ
jgi:hypothetical protein